MATTTFKSVDEYIAAQPETTQAVLQRVRSIIHKALPGADEVISYNIPAFRLSARPVIWLAGWKQHYSLYPVNGRVVEALKDELAPYKLRRGTVQFPLSQPVPEKLVARIAEFRAGEAGAR